MCGIVGIVGEASVSSRLVDALRRLEYRGYDSAGIAVISEAGILDRRRAPGKISALETTLGQAPIDGPIGIGHTRWATHGAPSEHNAHPHRADTICLVHNGIIENFQPLREALIAKGVQFESQTDTEVIAHLITDALRSGLNIDDAFSSTVDKLQGAYALAVIHSSTPDSIWVARAGSPLVIGLGETESYVGSDALALAGWTNQVVYLEEGDRARVNQFGVEIFDQTGTQVERPVQISRAVAGFADKGEYRHFMEKEIHEQPDAISHTLSRYLDADTLTFKIQSAFDWAEINRLITTACGTANYAGNVAKFWFEKFARLPVETDVASEFRYRDPVITAKDAALFVSQSGETADTLAALRHCKAAGAQTLALVNVPESSIAREAQSVAMTEAGPEIGVASTKAFTAQLTALACLAIGAGRARGHLSAEQETTYAKTLLEAPRLINQALACEPEIEKVAHKLTSATDVLYLGRNIYHPLAMEGALKLKEISYIHAEGYAAGELKHGPIALIEEGSPVVIIAPYDDLFEKTLSNMTEVIARGAETILITDTAGAQEAKAVAGQTIVMPNAPELIRPLIASIPIQLLAYHTAALKGTDVDQPRNLAKSVTVE